MLIACSAPPYPCYVCHQNVGSDRKPVVKAMQCSLCHRWVHGKCSGFNKALQKLESKLEFECPCCYEDSSVPYPFSSLLQDYEAVVRVRTAPSKNRLQFGHDQLVKLTRDKSIADQLTVHPKDLREWMNQRHTRTFDMDRTILHQIQGMIGCRRHADTCVCSYARQESLPNLTPMIKHVGYFLCNSLSDKNDQHST